MRRRVLLLAPMTSYRVGDFVRAAERLGLDPVLGTDRCDQLGVDIPARVLPLNLRDPDSAVATIVASADESAYCGIVGLDDLVTTIAAVASGRLGLPHSEEAAVERCRNKAKFRETLVRHGVRSPQYAVVGTDDDPVDGEGRVEYPCVLKPLHLSGSRGVIRVDDPAQFRIAAFRIGQLLRRPEVAHGADECSNQILIESFLPGPEFVVEGLLQEGRLHTLVLFDKPIPLDGPYFEESIYVTPSSISKERQMRLIREVERGANAVGLSHGPVHAELRWCKGNPWLIELAARTIGGRCSRVLRSVLDGTLEELVLRQAIGEWDGVPQRLHQAAGVMMLPIPGAGRLLEVSGLEAAQKVEGVVDVEITAPIGTELEPLPEGGSYLGFAFARASSPKEVIDALQEAHSYLQFRLSSTIRTF